MKDLAFFVLVTMLASSCASTSTSVMKTHTKSKPGCSEMNPDEIVLYREGMLIKKSYEILGKVFAEKHSAVTARPPRESVLVDELRKRAARLCTDALIGFHTSVVSGEGATGYRWASALAVRFVEKPEEREAQSRVPGLDLVISIPPAKIDTALKAGENSDYFQEIIRARSRYHLEKAGYYTTVLSDQITREDMEQMDEEKRQTLGGRDAYYILILSLRESKKEGGIAVGYTDSVLLPVVPVYLEEHKVQISAELVLKKTGETVWQKEGVGVGRAGNLQVLVEGTKEYDAIIAAVQKLYETVPPPQCKQQTDEDHPVQ